ncbi:MAG TPA: amino acid ABC transporter substrate-binding protein, partial [Burkholderiaceae bacterium]|nr:amino acid ABC transporter substrate-binding protein [Burkholderiaceae bacterium]
MNRWNKGLTALWVTLACAGSAWGGPVLDRIRQDGRLVIAHRDTSVPFSYVLPDGKPVGYAVELCQRIALAVQKQLKLDKLNVTYALVTSANRLEFIQKGQADLECGSTTNNAARREKVAFTIPHYITGARMLVKADSKVDRVDSLALKTVVSTKSTTPLDALRRLNAERGLNLKIIESANHQQGVDMVLKGEADAFVMDDVLLFGLVAALPDPTQAKVVGRYITTEPLAIMLSKDDPDFKKMVDDEMR